MELSSKATVETNTKTRLFKSIYSLETRQKMAAAKMGKKNPNYGKTGEDSLKWGGGSYTYYHTKARELHGGEVCDKCGLKLKDKASEQAFDMHCWGDYTQMRKENWTCICRSCHKKIHGMIDKLKQF